MVNLGKYKSNAPGPIQNTGKNSGNYDDRECKKIIFDQGSLNIYENGTLTVYTEKQNTELPEQPSIEGGKKSKRKTTRRKKTSHNKKTNRRRKH
jgi:hypothetical protein